MSDEMNPEMDGGVPLCAGDDCPQYDGKRCRLTGFRPDPGQSCEPAVREIVDERDRLRARVAELEATIADTLTRQADQARWSREVEEMQRSLADGHKRSAYQRGAEAMRERAAALCSALAYGSDWPSESEQAAASAYVDAAAKIRALPLDDDARESRIVFGPPARPLDEWHDDHGDVLWWTFPVCDPPYVGSPLDDDFPDHVTHWSPILVPCNGGERG